MNGDSTDQALAEDLAEVLAKHVRTLGPLGRIQALNRLLRVLRIVVRLVTEQRDRESYSAHAVWTQRKLAKLTGATTSTMQDWCEAGRKSVEAAD